MTMNPSIQGECWLCGDIHQESRRMLAALKQRGISHATLIILGDANVGLGEHTLSERYFTRFNEYMSERDIRVCFLRGNHDNPVFWETPIREDIERLWPQLHMLRQGAMDINGELYYIYPGAISIDRKGRREGVDWYPAEVMRPLALPNIKRPYRGIIGHNGPVPAGARHLGFWQQCEKDDTLAEDVATEETYIADAIARLTEHNARLGYQEALRYYHGHYHQSWEEDVQGVKGRCLGICELLQLA